MAPNMGPRYRIEIADPSGMRWIAMKKVAKEIKPTVALRESNMGLLPRMLMRLYNMYGNTKKKVPKARKKTTCIAGSVLRSLAMRFITENERVARSMNVMPLVIIINSKIKI